MTPTPPTPPAKDDKKLPAAPVAREAPPVPPVKAPTGPSSVKLTLTQDIFDEIAKLIGPIAKSQALALKLDDQHVKKKIPLVGEKEVATATNLRITQFDIAKVAMPIEDGHLAVELTDIVLKAETNVKAMGINFDKVVVSAQVDIGARLLFLLGDDGRVRTAVYDVKPNIDKFDTQIGTGFAGDVLEAVLDLFERVIKGVIQSSLVKPIQDALQDGLDSIVGRDMDVPGGLLNVAYLLKVNHRAQPAITKASGVVFDIAIDAFVNEAGAVDGVVKTDAFKGIKDLTPPAPAPAPAAAAAAPPAPAKK